RFPIFPLVVFLFQTNQERKPLRRIASLPPSGSLFNDKILGRRLQFHTIGLMPLLQLDEEIVAVAVTAVEALARPPFDHRMVTVFQGSLTGEVCSKNTLG